MTAGGRSWRMNVYSYLAALGIPVALVSLIAVTFVLLKIITENPPQD